MTVVVVAVSALVLVPVAALALYQWVLAIATLWPLRGRPRTAAGHRRRLVVLIPAHNEEATIALTLASLQHLAYPAELVRVVVIADRCDDDTVAITRRAGVDCFERQDGAAGKGAAIAWAIDRLLQRDAPFDGVVIVDADTIVHPGALAAFADRLAAGHDAQQGYNYLSNPWETPFTRLIAVTSVLRNGLFYQGKERLGLPAMLSGTGMCFSRALLAEHGWNAFSVGEDWEFSVSLLLAGRDVHFNSRARVMARESRGFGQASSQRLRWASGRHAVAATGASQLFRRGMRTRRIGLCDAALTIVAPTYSVQASVAVACLAAGWLLPPGAASHLLTAGATIVAAALTAYFLLGVALTESPLNALAGIILIPAFLPWRLVIEFLGLAGFGRKRWVRTTRPAPGA